MKLYFSLLSVLIITISCAHQATNQAPVERLISRMGNLTQRPAWVLESTPLLIQKNKLIALGTSALTDEHKLDVSYRIAERNGKHLFQSSLEQEFEVLFKNLSKPTAAELKHLADVRVEFLRMTHDELKLTQKYWEKVEVTKGEEPSANQNKVFVSLEMNKDLFSKKVDQVIAKFQKKKYLSKSSAKQIKTHWLNYLDSLTLK